MHATMRHVIGISLLCTIGLLGCAASGPPQRVVDDNIRAAQDTFSKVQADSAGADFHESLKKAKAVLIITPGNNRAVALARSNNAQGWSSPAFYNVTMLGTGARTGTMGFSKVPNTLQLVALAMSDKAVAAFVKPRLPGTDDLTVYTVSGTMTGGSRRLAANAAEADLLVYTTRQGAGDLAKSMAEFGSPLISIDVAANQSYYGRPVTTADILMSQTVSNPSAAALQKTVAGSD
jgi:lipid-binding SYLF domain-containing protein